MTPCDKCGLIIGADCVCDAVDAAFSDPAFAACYAEIEELEVEEDAAAKPDAQRCAACLFFACRCARGHSERLKRL